MKKPKNYQPYAIILIVLIVIIFFAFFFASRSSSINILESNAKTMDDGWYTYVDSEKVYIDQLPTEVDYDSQNISTVYIELNSDFLTHQSILLRSSLQNIKVYLDDELIYEHVTEASSQVPMASLWHIVDISAHSNGKVLSVELGSPYERFAGVINDVHYGTNGDLYVYLFETFGYRLALGFIIFILALIVLIVNQFIDNEHSNGRIYLATLVLLVSTWIMMESKLVQLFIPNQFIIGAVPYLMVALMGIPISIFVKNYVSIKFKKVFLIFAIYYTLQFFVVVGLELFNMMDYFESAIYVQSMILVGALTTVALMIVEYYKYHSDVARKFLNHFLVVVIFAVTEITNFIFSDFVYTSVYGLVILTLYTLYMVVRYIIQINYRFKLSYKLEVVNQLIYIDALTGGKNRYAFENDFEKTFNNPNINHQLRLVMFDFDNFKEINDSYGHVEGDETLKTGLSVIDAVFGKYGQCYRIGGDEFSCIMKSSSKDLYLECLKDLEVALHNVFEDKPFELNISVGSSIYLDNSFDKPSDMYRLADQNMYTNKHTKKDKKG